MTFSIYNVWGPSSSLVSIQDCKEEVKSSNLHSAETWEKKRMNIYTFDIFFNHCISLEEIIEDNRIITLFHYVDIGPLNMPETVNLNIIKESIRNISSIPLTSKWWTDFSTLHSVVTELLRRFQLLEDATCSIENINENGNIMMDLLEHLPTVMKGYQITAKRRNLRTLKRIAAYNVAKNISTLGDIQMLQIPQSLHEIVNTFLDTYFGDYMNV